MSMLTALCLAKVEEALHFVEAMSQLLSTDGGIGNIAGGADGGNVRRFHPHMIH